MKKLIIILVIVALIVAFILFRKKLTNTQYLKPEIKAIKINVKTATDVAIGLLKGFDAQAEIIIKNFGTQKYNISALLANLYAPDGAIVAEQVNPLSGNVDILPGGQISIPVQYTINAGGILKLAKQIGNTDIVETLTNYLNDRTLGADVLIKGFFVSEGIQFDLNESAKI